MENSRFSALKSIFWVIFSLDLYFIISRKVLLAQNNDFSKLFSAGIVVNPRFPGEMALIEFMQQWSTTMVYPISSILKGRKMMAPTRSLIGHAPLSQSFSAYAIVSEAIFRTSKNLWFFIQTNMSADVLENANEVFRGLVESTQNYKKWVSISGSFSITDWMIS